MNRSADKSTIPHRHRGQVGFSLVEILITVVIMGVIAAFSVSKLLVPQNQSEYNMSANSAAYMVLRAYETLRANGSLSSTTGVKDMTPYMNYVAVDTTSSIDHKPAFAGSVPCNSTYGCLRLHNGGILLYGTANTFGGTASTNAVWFHFDPDGRYTNSPDGSSKSIQFFLYYNGALRTNVNTRANTVSGGVTYNPVAGGDPSWFSWH